jgi:hypothetical protein
MPVSPTARAVLALAFSLIGDSAHAWTGRQLLTMYELGESGRMTVGAYAAGVADSELTLVQLAKERDSPIDATKLACIPPAAMVPLQLGDVVYKFLKENPARHHEPAYALTRDAFVTAWRCRP